MTAIKAEALEVCGEIKQGELILINQNNAQTINFTNNLQNKRYTLDSEGTGLIALPRDAAPEMNFNIITIDGKKEYYSIKVKANTWDVQKISGVPAAKVTPSNKDIKQIKREQQDVAKALNNFTTDEYWKKGFIIPLQGKISGNFGNQRIFNGIPKSPHSGTDIAAPEGTPVKAAGDGTVVLSGKDYFYTGNMIIINHGYGLQTIYAHLQTVNVKEGDVISQGDFIGTVGKTGRATGSHLHWGASVNNIRFNPFSLLNINNKTCHEITENKKGNRAK